MKVVMDSKIVKLFSKVSGPGFEEVMIKLGKNGISVNQGSKDKQRIVQLHISKDNEELINYEVKKELSFIVHDINTFLKYFNLFGDEFIEFGFKDDKVILKGEKKQVEIFTIEEEYFDKNLVRKKDVEFEITAVKKRKLEELMKSYNMVSAEYLQLLKDDKGDLSYVVGEKDVIKGVLKEEIKDDIVPVYLSNEFISNIRVLTEDVVDMHIEENMVSLKEKTDTFVYIVHTATVEVEV